MGAGARIGGRGAHLDPDLLTATKLRRPGWKPSLGQIGSAAGHLRNQGVGTGDLFLFYGWFQRTARTGGGLRYSSEPGIHAIYGYLEVGEVIIADRSHQLPEWLTDHPHAVDARRAKATNTIFVARKSLSDCEFLPGAGVFRINNDLVLTKPGMSRGRWALDESLFRHLAISYHDDSAWKEGYFQSYPRAQEYVVDADARARAWAIDLIQKSATWKAAHAEKRT